MFTLWCFACKNYHDLEIKKKHGLTPSMVNLMKDDMVVALGLSMLASNIKKKICDILDGFFFFHFNKVWKDENP